MLVTRFEESLPDFGKVLLAEVIHRRLSARPGEMRALDPKCRMVALTPNDAPDDEVISLFPLTIPAGRLLP